MAAIDAVEKNPVRVPNKRKERGREIEKVKEGKMTYQMRVKVVMLCVASRENCVGFGEEWCERAEEAREERF